MKTSYIIMAIMVAAICSSCSTTEKFYVSGNPNTEIYTPNYNRVGTIGSNGKAKIEIPSDDFYAFFLSKSPNSELYVPFALDYKKKGRFGTKILKGTGMTLAGAGLVLEVAGLAAAIAEGEDEGGVGTPLMLAGLGTLGVGTAIGAPATWRLEQKSYEYQYQYLTNQQTNEDFHFTKATFNEPLKGATQTEAISKSRSKIVDESTSVSKKRLSEKSSRSLKDYGRQVDGEYTGNGTLTQNSEIIESYSEAKIVIERISKNEVSVNVIVDGEAFFETPSKYKITKNKNGSFSLKHSSVSTATITISKNGNLIYQHPKINIEGEIYALKISAKNN